MIGYRSQELVSSFDYEAMKRAWELQEHREIYKVVEERKETDVEAYISFDEMAKRLNIDVDAL